MISKERVLWESLLQAESRMANLERIAAKEKVPYGEFSVLHDVIGQLRCQLRDDHDIDLDLLACEAEEFLDKKLEIQQKKFDDNQKAWQEADELVAKIVDILDKDKYERN